VPVEQACSEVFTVRKCNLRDETVEKSHRGGTAGGDISFDGHASHFDHLGT